MTTATNASNSFLHRLTAFRQRFGVKGTINKSVDVLLKKVLHASVHAVVWLDVDALAELPAPDPRFAFRFLTADEVAKYVADPAFYLFPDLAEGVRDGHELCYAALDGDRLAAIACYSLGVATPDKSAGATFSFPDHVAYMSYGYTHPDYRGARLHGYVMGLALKELAQRGITKFVSLVSWSNEASLKSCWRLGYIHLGHMITFGSATRAGGFYPKRAKELGVRFGRQAKQRGSC